MDIIDRKTAKENGDTYYFTGKECKNGHVDQRFCHNSVCRECCRESGRSWYNKNKLDKSWKKERIIKNVRNRAKLKNIEFNLEVEDLEWNDICPVLGIELDYTGQKRWSQVSLDRTDPSKGYIKSNTVVMSMRANSLKQDICLDEAHKLYQYLVETLKH